MIQDPATTDVTVVIPTVGRPQLERCLSALADASGPLPHRVIVVDDRPGDQSPLQQETPPALSGVLEIHRSGGRGPAGARNAGWAAAATAWVAFLDDDVQVTPTWRTDLAADLTGADLSVAGMQGNIEVRPTLHQHRPLTPMRPP